MGEYADMLLDGEACQHCGEFFFDDNAMGFPRSCCTGNTIKGQPQHHQLQKEVNAGKAEFQSLTRELKRWWKPLCKIPPQHRYKALHKFFALYGLPFPKMTPDRLTNCGKNESRYEALKALDLEADFHAFRKQPDKYTKKELTI